MKDSLQDHVQSALKEERELAWGDNLYLPSSGQIMSHVDHRVAAIAARAAAEWFRLREEEDWASFHPGRKP